MNRRLIFVHLDADIPYLIELREVADEFAKNFSQCIVHSIV
jgi:hypothetical protein